MALWLNYGHGTMLLVMIETPTVCAAVSALFTLRMSGYNQPFEVMMAPDFHGIQNYPFLYHPHAKIKVQISLNQALCGPSLGIGVV